MPQRTLFPVFPESCHSFLLLQWRQARSANPLPPLAAGSQPSAAPQGRPSAPPAQGSCGRLPSAAPRPLHVTSASPHWWAENTHYQLPDQPRTLHLPHLPIHIFLLWLWCCGFEELHETVSSPISWGLRTCWGAWPMTKSSLRISRNHTTRPNSTEYAFYLGSVNQSQLEMPKLATDKNPLLYGFLENHYPSKNWVTHKTNLHKNLAWGDIP